MKTEYQQELDRTIDTFAALPEDERKRIEERHRTRRAEGQIGIMKLHKHSELLTALVNLDTDRAREYVTMMGQVGVGNLTDEQEDEITNFINESAGAQMADLMTLIGRTSQENMAEFLKNAEGPDIAKVAAAHFLKD